MDAALTSISKIIKSEKKIQTIEDLSFDETLVLKVKHEDEAFILMAKEAFDRYYVININNPVSFGDIDPSTNPYELANKCNRRAIGSKCMTVEGSPTSFIFSREELIGKDDVRNRKYIIDRVMLALIIVTEGPSILVSCLDENNENDEIK